MAAINGDGLVYFGKDIFSLSALQVVTTSWL